MRIYIYGNNILYLKYLTYIYIYIRITWQHIRIYDTATLHTAGVSHHYVSAMFCWRDPGSDEGTHSDWFPSCSEWNRAWSNNSAGGHQPHICRSLCGSGFIGKLYIITLLLCVCSRIPASKLGWKPCQRFDQMLWPSSGRRWRRPEHLVET